MAQYAPEVVAFDAVGALQFKGVPEYRAHWQRCFEFCQGEGFFETHELHVDVGGELACSRMLSHCGGPNAEGEMQSAWMRGTRVWARRGGDWKVIHEHFDALRHGDRPGMHVVDTFGGAAGRLSAAELRRSIGQALLPAASFSASPAPGASP